MDDHTLLSAEYRARSYLKRVNRLVRGFTTLRGRFGLHINLPDMERGGAVWSEAERMGDDVKSGAGRTDDGAEDEAERGMKRSRADGR